VEAEEARSRAATAQESNAPAAELAELNKKAEAAAARAGRAAEGPGDSNMLKGRLLIWPEHPELIEACLKGHAPLMNRATAIRAGPPFAIKRGLLLYRQEIPRGWRDLWLYKNTHCSTKEIHLLQDQET